MSEHIVESNVKLLTIDDIQKSYQFSSAEYSVEKTLFLEPVNKYVSNIKGDTLLFMDNSQLYLCLRNQNKCANSYICSPYATYVRYPLDICDRIFSKNVYRWLVKAFLPVMGLLFKLTKIDKNIYINNNLSSVLRHDENLVKVLPGIITELNQKYPKNGLILTRVNEVLDAEILNILRELGFSLFSDRITHLYYPGSTYLKRSHTKRDMSLLKKTTYKVSRIIEHKNDVTRIHELYHKLFVQKHTPINPCYTKEYFYKSIKYGWHEYRVLRNPEGKIDAFISWFTKGNIMTCGPLGYDTALDSKLGLYRMLISTCFKELEEHNYIFNMGAGSDEFKRNRGSVTALEYTAIYCQHLPFYRRLPWSLLQFVFKYYVRNLKDRNAA